MYNTYMKNDSARKGDDSSINSRLLQFCEKKSDVVLRTYEWAGQ
jgi:hypothetical protein